MQIINTENIHKYLQPGKIKRIHKILALCEKSGGFEKYWHFSENQADLKNIGAFTKIRRIWKILALFKKSGGFGKYWRFYKNQADLENVGAMQKNRRTIESWRALKSPRLVKNQRDWKPWRPAYCLGSAESPAADFLLDWLKSSRSDPRRCVASLMQTPSEETAQAALLLRADPLPYCTGCCIGPTCQNSCGNQYFRQTREFSPIPVKSQKS
jgi:hypothetical protein